MYPLGHIAVGLIIGYGIQLLNRDQIDKRYRHYLPYIVVLGAIFPDLFDKPMLLVGFGSGRWFAHSIIGTLFFFLLAVMTVKIMDIFIVTEFNSKLTYNNLLLLPIAFLCGMVAHLICDIPIPPRVIFWPFLGSFPDRNLSNELIHDMRNPFNLITEFIGYLILLIFTKQRDWTKLLILLVFILGFTYVLTLFAVFILLHGNHY